MRITKTDYLGSIASSGSGGQPKGKGEKYSHKYFPPVKCVFVDAVKSSSPTQRQVLDKELLIAEKAMHKRLTAQEESKR